MEKRDVIKKLVILCAALILAGFICVPSTGTYARYAATYRATHDIVLTVEPGTYAIVYHYGEGITSDQAAEDQDVQTFICRIGETVTIPAVDEYYVRTGYKGTAWNTSPDGTGTDYTAGYIGADIAEGGKTLNLYAIWDANIYRVNYAVNIPEAARGQAENVPDSAEWAYDADCVLAEAPHIAGYVFDGWFLDEACSQKLGDAGAALERPNLSSADGDTVDIYAGWSPGSAEYTVNHWLQKLDSIGKTALQAGDYELTESVVYTGITGSEITPGTVSRIGFVSPTPYAGTIENDGSGIWNYYYDRESYVLSYNANGGTRAPAKETVYYGELHTLSSRVPVRSNYVFLGWFEQTDGTEELEAVEITSDMTVYARWRLDTVKITYMPNLLPSDYTQVEWIEGDGASYIKTDLMLNEDSQVRIIYELTEAYSGSGGIFGAGGDATFAASANAAGLMLNYGASDAQTESTGVTAALYDSSPVSLNVESDLQGKHVLYANRHVWRIDSEIRAVFAYETFETAEGAMLFAQDDAQGYLKGRIYGAQFMSRSGLEASLVPAVSSSGEPGMYDVQMQCFYSNAGTGEFTAGPETEPRSKDAVRRAKIQAMEDPFERNGYCLTGWNTKADGSGVSYRPGAYITPREDMTLYAIWEYSVPTLKAGHSWYDADQGGDESLYTEIHIVDLIDEEIREQAQAVWNADEDDTGTIKCYRLGTQLWIAGNGTGAIYMAQDASGMFQDINASGETDVTRAFTQTERIGGLDLLDASRCETMEWMFTALSQDADDEVWTDVGVLGELSGIESWDVSGVQSMAGMCCGLAALTALPDLSAWDISGVLSLEYAFAGCSGLESLYLGTWDTSQIEILYRTFYCCDALEWLNLKGWDLSLAADVSSMFEGCTGLSAIYVSDTWSIGTAVADYDMFYDCISLTGGAGTGYSAEHTGSDYANIDTEDDPGYLTDAAFWDEMISQTTLVVMCAEESSQNADLAIYDAESSLNAELAVYDAESSSNADLPVYDAEALADIQQRYIAALFRYEGSLYDEASGEFTPGISPLTGIAYISKDEWIHSDEYMKWARECEYLKSLLS